MSNIQQWDSTDAIMAKFKSVLPSANALILTGIVGLALICCSISQASESTVGFVRAVKGKAVSETRDGQSRPLQRNAEVFLHDVITTDAQSFVVISFKDDSVVTVRPKSQFKVEEFHFDQNAKKATLNLTKGGLRIITGKISKNQPENYRLKTPVASMGVRGTRFDARLCEDDCASEERLITNSQ